MDGAAVSAGDEVDVRGEFDIGEEEALVVPGAEEPVPEVELDVVDVLPWVGVVGEGTKPACQTTLPPDAVGSETMLVRIDLSVNATVLEVEGQKHGSALVMVFCAWDCGHATHCSEVPLQYTRPVQGSAVEHIVSPNRFSEACPKTALHS
jgi:hypothetical protein